MLKLLLLYVCTLNQDWSVKPGLCILVTLPSSVHVPFLSFGIWEFGCVCGRRWTGISKEIRKSMKD